MFKQAPIIFGHWHSQIGKFVFTLICHQLYWLTLSLTGKIKLFTIFILYPKINVKSVMVFRALGMEFLGSDKKQKEVVHIQWKFVYVSSSANSCQRAVRSQWNSQGLNGNIKEQRVRGHPWLVPLNKEKYFDILLFVLTAACVQVYNRFTQEHNEGPNPKV